MSLFVSRKIIIVVLALIATHGIAQSKVIWDGLTDKAIEVAPSSASGLDAVWVLSSVDGVSLAVESASRPQWYKYSNLGGGYAEEVTDVSWDNGYSMIGSLEGDMGYIVEHPDGRRECFWIVDYSRHPFSINSISESTERDCGRMALDVSGEGAEMVYYGINGRRFVIDREIKIRYSTLVPDEEQFAFVQIHKEESFTHMSSPMRVESCLCPTTFLMSGDRFLREWGIEVEVESPLYDPYSVNAMVKAEQSGEIADNEVQTGDSSGSMLGGSAPSTIQFEAVVSDAAIFREWQFSRYPGFDDIDLRISDLSFSHTFTEEGMNYVRFVCANSDGSCQYESESYTVNIGASMLRCPNAFSPGNADGVNDEWKVSYSSIIDFKCSIFDRYGRKMVSLTSPSQGWDGKYKGKLVPAGAYFYVIKAIGADGKKYELSGDINIINYK